MLAVGLVAVAVIALVHGTRRLWQQRAAPLLLLAAWPVPWRDPARALAAAFGPGVATALATGAVLLVLAALLAGPRLRRRYARRYRLAPAAARLAVTIPSPGRAPVPAVGPSMVALQVREPVRVAS